MAYWYLEARYPIHIAVTGGIVLAILEVSLEKILFKHIHKLSKLNFVILLVLGSLSLAGEEGLWFRLQPFITGVIMGFIIFISLYKGKGLMWEMMEEFKRPLPPYDLWRVIERNLGFFFLGYGTFMGAMAIWGTTDQWLFFKTIGQYVVFLIFLILQMLWMRRKLKKMPLPPPPS